MINLKEQITHISRNIFISDVLDSIQKQLETTEFNAKDLEFAIVINSDEKTISKWEEWLKLPKSINFSLKDRSDRVIYSINSRGFFTKKFLKDQARIFTNGEIQVNEKFEKYHFEIEFTSIIGLPPNMEVFSNMIDVNKPAKLTYSFKYRYRTHKEVRVYHHSFLNGLTHAEIRAKANPKMGEEK
ncbi:MAG: putative phage tail protein [Fusobacteriaceae bacterium]